MNQAPLIGRTDVLNRANTLIQRVAVGSGGALLLEGEPGIGKSRLAAASVRSAIDGGARAFVGRADETRAAKPYLLLRDAFGDPGGSGSGSATSTEAFLDLVESLAVSRPLLLVAEDLQWADDGTLQTLNALVRRSGQLAVGIVATARLAPRPALLHRLVESITQHDGSSVLVSPFDRADVSDLVTSMLGAAPGPRLLQQLEGAAGNPLFIVELVRALVDEGDIAIFRGRAEIRSRSLPPTFRTTVLRRLGFLSEGARSILQVAAVFGRRFAMADVAAVFGTPSAKLLTGVQEAATAGLVIDDGGKLAFRHDLVRQAIYEAMPASMREALHADVGRALAASGAAFDEIARHLALGAPRGDSEAIAWLREAAAAVIAREPVVAADLLSRAIDLSLPGPEIDRDRARMASALLWSGRTSAAHSAAQAVLTRSCDTDALREARSVVAGAMVLEGRLSEAVVAFDAIASDDGTPAVQRTRAECEAALARVLSGDIAGALAKTSEAPSATVDPVGRCVALCARAVAFNALAETETAESLAREATSLVDGPDGDEAARYQPHLIHALTLLDLDRFDEAVPALEAGRVRAEQIGAVSSMAYYHWGAALLHFDRGAWDDAAAEAEAALLLAEDYDSRAFVVWPNAVLSHIAVRRGDLAGARDAIAAAASQIAATGAQLGVDWLLHAQALLAEADGDTALALTFLTNAFVVYEAAGAIAAHWRYAPDLVRLAIEADDVALATQVVARLEEAASRTPASVISRVTPWARGLLARNADAIVEGAQALASCERPFVAASAALDAGVALNREDRAREAQPWLSAAAASFGELRASRDEARAVAELRAAGVRRGARGPRARPTTGWDSLTTTERRIVELVAQGKSNPEIAAHLFISRRTVTTHLTHIFAKLGVPSRVALATLYIQRTI